MVDSMSMGKPVGEEQALVKELAEAAMKLDNFGVIFAKWEQATLLRSWYQSHK